MALLWCHLDHVVQHEPVERVEDVDNVLAPRNDTLGVRDELDPAAGHAAQEQTLGGAVGAQGEKHAALAHLFEAEALAAVNVPGKDDAVGLGRAVAVFDEDPKDSAVKAAPNGARRGGVPLRGVRGVLLEPIGRAQAALLQELVELRVFYYVEVCDVCVRSFRGF